MPRAEIITVERRRRWSLSDKQQIVGETLKPGASVSMIAQRYGLHSSQLFAWRKAARDGRLIEDAGIDFAPVILAPERPEPAALPPATIPVNGPTEIVSARDEPRLRARRTGTIEITFACGARVCVRGQVSPETLRQVVELLR